MGTLLLVRSLHYEAGAHYEEDILHRADVLQRVVGDGDEVGGVAGGEAADFGFDGLAL